MRISDWSSDVCSSDLHGLLRQRAGVALMRSVDGEADRPHRAVGGLRGHPGGTVGVADHLAAPDDVELALHVLGGDAEHHAATTAPAVDRQHQPRPPPTAPAALGLQEEPSAPTATRPTPLSRPAHTAGPTHP